MDRIQDFPGGQAAKTPHVQCRGCVRSLGREVDPYAATKDLTYASKSQHSQINKELQEDLEIMYFLKNGQNSI